MVFLNTNSTPKEMTYFKAQQSILHPNIPGDYTEIKQKVEYNWGSIHSYNQLRNDFELSQSSSSRGGNVWSDSGNILKVERMQLVGGF